MVTMLEAYQNLTNNLVNRVNDQRGLSNRVRDTMVSREAGHKFLEHLLLAAERGLAVGQLSEASLRVSGNKFLITAVNCWFPNSSKKELKIGSLDAGWSMDSEDMPRHIAWHREIFATTDIGAILLSQPAAATVMAAKRSLPDAELLVEAKTAVGGILCVAPETDLICAGAASAHALLVAGYGLITLGDDLAHAVSRAETVERWCQIAIQS